MTSSKSCLEPVNAASVATHVFHLDDTSGFLTGTLSESKKKFLLFTAVMPETAWWKELLFDDTRISLPESAPTEVLKLPLVPMSRALRPSPTYTPLGNLTFLSRATTAGKVADALSQLSLLYMLWRTLYYIYRRKNGGVGPNLLSSLLKFWATWGLAHFASLVLSLYLSPLGLSWMISFIRAAFLIALSWGANLPVALYVYDAHLHPFLESNEPEVEAQFAALRERWAEVKLRLTDIADELLTRYAIGGVAGVTGRGPGQKELAVQQADEFDPRTGRRVQQPRLPESHALSPSEQKFFTGGSNDAVETVAEAAYKGVLIRAKHDAPKAAYTDSRALRAAFRRRARNGREAALKNDDAQ